jgi:hypothetical protein
MRGVCSFVNRESKLVRYLTLNTLPTRGKGEYDGSSEEDAT